MDSLSVLAILGLHCHLHHRGHTVPQTSLTLGTYIMCLCMSEIYTSYIIYICFHILVPWTASWKNSEEERLLGVYLMSLQQHMLYIYISMLTKTDPVTVQVASCQRYCEHPDHNTPNVMLTKPWSPPREQKHNLYASLTKNSASANMVCTQEIPSLIVANQFIKP